MNRSAHSIARGVTRLLLFTTFALMVGCGTSPPSPREVAVPTVRGPSPRLDVAPKTPLVIVLPRDAAALTEPLEACLDDGTQLPAALYRVRVTLPAASASAENAAWLPPAGQWRAMKASRDLTGGTQVIVVDAPDAFDASELSISYLHYRLHWLPHEQELPPTNTPPSEPLLNAWRPVAEAALLADPALQGRIKGEAASPITRWRYRLLMDGLIPTEQPSAVNAFDDPVIEAIARQNEARWRVALAWTWRNNPDLAWRLKQSLARVVDFGGGVYAPAWSVNHAALDRLLLDLLDPVLSPARRAEIAEAWLLAQPAGVAWVIDDGGLLDDARRQFISSIGLANLTDHATQVWIDTRESPAADFRPLLSLSTVKLLVPAAPLPDRLLTPLVPHIGQWAGILTIQSARVPVVPPGFVMAPLINDYTLERWSGAPAGPPPQTPEWTTAALLHRLPDEAAVANAAVESRRWELVVECRLPVSVTDISILDREAVRIFIGPTQHPLAILRVDMTGEVVNEVSLNPLLPAELAPPPGHIDITRAADRWLFRLVLPPGSVQPDLTIQLGLTRTDGLGRRSAWPRPMLPWQEVVSRAALDAGAWSKDNVP